MSIVDDARRTGLEQIGNCEKVLTWAEAKAPPLIHWVVDNDTTTKNLAQPQKEAIAASLQGILAKLIDLSRQILNAFREMLSMLGNPEELRRLAGVFKHDISGKATSLARTFTSDSLTSLLDSNWVDGDASEIYEHAFETQAAPLAEVSKTADVLHDALWDLAKGIEDYYLQLGLAVAGGVASIGGAVVGVLGLLEAAGTLPTVAGPVIGVSGASVAFTVALVGLITSLGSFIAVFQTVAHAVGDTLDSLPETIEEWDSPAFLKAK